MAHNCHGKNKNITAKPKTSRQKQNASWQNQVLHSKSKIALVLLWVFAFAVRYLVFAVRSLVLPWGFWFCCEVFCFCHEVFVFGVRFSVLPWDILFLPWGFWFCRDSSGPLYWNLKTCHCLFYIHYFHTDVYRTKFCITIVSNFSWVLQSSQEKSKTMVRQNFGG